MRYSSHPPRTFRNRSARYLGVLVAAALVAALGLPSAVQAQTPLQPIMAHVSGADSISAMARHVAPTMGHTHWVVEFNLPGVSANSMKAGPEDDQAASQAAVTLLARGDEGAWGARVMSFEGMLKVLDPAGVMQNVDEETPKAIKLQGGGYVIMSTAPSAADPSPWSPWATYTHGEPEMPEDFEYVSRPGTDVHIFTWTDVFGSTKDQGIEKYTLRWTAGDPLLRATKWEEKTVEDGYERLSPAESKKLEDGETYIFELTVTAMSSSRGDRISDATSLMVPIGMGDEGPTPTPTLPEIAALFLAMLLLGSGAYLLRRRQSGGGLTPA